jgi:hypothetical protein
LLCALADYPRHVIRVERTHYTLEELTPTDARSLEGKRARFRIALDSRVMIALTALPPPDSTPP